MVSRHLSPTALLRSLGLAFRFARPRLVHFYMRQSSSLLYTVVQADLEGVQDHRRVLSMLWLHPWLARNVPLPNLYSPRLRCIRSTADPFHSCRVIGASTMLGVSAYGMLQWVQTPKPQRLQRVFLLGTSSLFAAAGIARALWPEDREPAGANSGAEGQRADSEISEPRSSR